MNSPTPLLAAGTSNAALYTFLIYTMLVFGLAWLSNRLLKSKSFLSEYFLGSRGLGVWAFALTFAATSASGGSFTGFPSKIYTHGWVLGLWIGSYIVVPICAMGLLGKRINNVARISGSITVPDVLRDRFRSPVFGLVSVSLIIFFMSFNLVAQFKAGSLILMTLLNDVTIFQDISTNVSGMIEGIDFLGGVDAGYLICLLTFGVAVIIYTTYGGFHAVVWTDVMQGVVMVIGVLLMLPLALYAVGKTAPDGTGGLDYATRQMIEMVPPEKGTATISLPQPAAEDLSVKQGDWLTLPGREAGTIRLFRVTKLSVITSGRKSVEKVPILEIITPGDIQRVLKNSPDDIRQDVTLSDLDTKRYAYGAEPGRKGVYLTGPGPSEKSADGFLPLSLAFSFFFMWAISGSGQPASMVRLMAFKNSQTLRRSIFTVAIYYSAIYFPLVIIFCCARILMPGMEGEPDRIMPAMAVFLTENIGMGWLAGLLVAAPFAAVMSTVDSFLLMISSALVRDIYQRNINPDVQERQIKILSYAFTMIVGTGAIVGAINPPQFLQDIIVYTGSGLAAAFLAPMIFGLYWPRSNVHGCMAGMLAGFGVHLLMYVGGIFANDSFFKPYRLLNFDPIIVGLFTSFLVTWVVVRLTPPPPEDLVRKYFYKQSA